MIDRAAVIEAARSAGDDWLRWRADRLDGRGTQPEPSIPGQEAEGGFFGPSGRVSPGATGLALCHLLIVGLDVSGPATIAADWLQEVRTPAEAWLDAPDDVPGELDTPAGGRVWATASATCALLSVDRDPGPRAIDLLRGEADMEGRFTGGAYPTFAAAGAYWLAEGPKTEIAEWGLRWAREATEDWWGTDEVIAGLTFWGAARIPAEHPSVELFVDLLLENVTDAADTDTALRSLELTEFFGV